MDLYFVVGLISAIGSVLTAFFMYPNYCSTAIKFKASVRNLPLADRRGNPNEKLQEQGFFLLEITFCEIPTPTDLKAIEVTSARIPKNLCNEYDEFTGGSIENLSFGKSAFPIHLKKNDSLTIQFPIRPQNPDGGILCVEISYGLFRKARAKCKYQRTYYYPSVNP